MIAGASRTRERRFIPTHSNTSGAHTFGRRMSRRHRKIKPVCNCVQGSRTESENATEHNRNRRGTALQQRAGGVSYRVRPHTGHLPLPAPSIAARPVQPAGPGLHARTGAPTQHLPPRASAAALPNLALTCQWTPPKREAAGRAGLTSDTSHPSRTASCEPRTLGCRRQQARCTGGQKCAVGIRPACLSARQVRGAGAVARARGRSKKPTRAPSTRTRCAASRVRTGEQSGRS